MTCKHINEDLPTVHEHNIGTRFAVVVVCFPLRDQAAWHRCRSIREIQLDYTLMVDGWTCNEVTAYGLSGFNARYSFRKPLGRKVPDHKRLVRETWPTLAWLDEKLGEILRVESGEAATIDEHVKASVTARTRDDILRRVYSAYHAEAKRKLNTDARIKELRKEAEDAARADIAWNWNDWRQNIDSTDYVTLETGRVTLPEAELTAAVDRGVIEAVSSLKDGTFARPPSLTLRGE